LEDIHKNKDICYKLKKLLDNLNDEGTKILTDLHWITFKCNYKYYIMDDSGFIYILKKIIEFQNHELKCYEDENILYNNDFYLDRSIERIKKWREEAIIDFYKSIIKK
jgi:hypothetical protein